MARVAGDSSGAGAGPRDVTERWPASRRSGRDGLGSAPRLLSGCERALSWGREGGAGRAPGRRRKGRLQHQLSPKRWVGTYRLCVLILSHFPGREPSMVFVS